ncbi:MAG TPA: methyltransferase domain-containing protein, partial [Candidatus Acidoferrales bacterium]|nr:methyltransferase domain-containing protein [Candidatus Acidoferrales bacterium]
MLAGWLGSADRVLVVGQASGDLPELLDSTGRDVTGVVFEAAAKGEAQVFCSSVAVIGSDDHVFPDELGSATFDAIVFDGALEHLEQPWALLADAKRLLREGGLVLAALPNIRFGAIRLALIKGSPVALGNRFAGFTSESSGELFVRAGYRVARVSRLQRRIFEPVASLPIVERTEFSSAILAEVESDPDAHVFEFLVAASPASSDEAGRVAGGGVDDSTALREAAAAFDSQKSAMAAELERNAALERVNELAGKLAAQEAAAREVWRRNEALETSFREATKAAEAVQQRAAAMSARVEAMETANKERESIRAALAEKTREAEEVWTEVVALRKQSAALEAEAEQAREQVLEVRTRLEESASRLAALESSERAARYLQETSQAEVDRLRTQTIALEQHARESRSLLDAANARDAEHAADRRAANERLEAANAGLADLRRRIAAVERERQDARDSLGTARSELAKRETELQEVRWSAAGRISELEASEQSEKRQRDLLLAELDGARGRVTALEENANATYVELTAANKRVADLDSWCTAQAARIAEIEGSETAARTELSAVAAREAELGKRAAELEASEQSEKRQRELLLVELSSARDRVAALEESAHTTYLELAAAKKRVGDSDVRYATQAAELTAIAAREANLLAREEIQNARIGELAEAESSARVLYDEAKGELTRARWQAENAERRARETDAAVRAARETEARLQDRIAQLETLAGEQRTRFLELEEHALLALDESEAKALAVEADWFAMYGELEAVRASSGELELALDERSTLADALARKVDKLDETLRREIEKHDSTRTEVLRARAELATTHAELIETRERADGSMAKAAQLKVQVVRAELQISELELLASERARQLRDLDAELEATRQASQAQIEATRKAALAERIVMRDYADETQARNDARARDFEAIIANLNRESEERRQQLENLLNELNRVR